MKVGENCMPKPGSEQFSLSQDEVAILIENMNNPRLKSHAGNPKRFTGYNIKSNLAENMLKYVKITCLAA